MSSRDNTYTNKDNRTFYLSDDVDNESIGKLIWYLLYQIQEDDEKDEKEKDYNIVKLQSIHIAQDMQ